jgi:hypothetical protein
MAPRAESTAVQDLPPEVWKLVRSLIDHESAEELSILGRRDGLLRAYEKLCFQLSSLLGRSGVEALVSRALALSKENHPWLKAVRINADGSLSGFRETSANPELEQSVEAGMELVARIVGLLVCFVGKSITLQILKEAWPQTALILEEV